LHIGLVNAEKFEVAFAIRSKNSRQRGGVLVAGKDDVEPQRLDTSSLWLGTPTCQRAMISPHSREALSSCPQRDRVKYRAVCEAVKGLDGKKVEKAPAALIGPCFEAYRLGTGFPPVALALGASDVYKTIMRRPIRSVK
jgi:hypothetical protein